MSDDNMIHETSQPAENGLQNQRPGDTEEDDDMADDGKMCINHSAYMNRFSVCYQSVAYTKTFTILLSKIM
jgi:hypothetical protein